MNGFGASAGFATWATAAIFGDSFAVAVFCPKGDAPNPLLPKAFGFPNEGEVPDPSIPDDGAVFTSGAPNRDFVCMTLDGGLVGVEVAFSGITKVILPAGGSFDEGVWNRLCG